MADKILPNIPAPERAFGERTGDPFVGGSLPTSPRLRGLQPGIDYEGIPLMAWPRSA